MVAFTLPFSGAYSVIQGYGPTKARNEYKAHGYNGTNGLLWHGGIDYGMPVHTPVLAAGAGTVLVAQVADGSSGAYYFVDFGTLVVLDHGGGLWTLYGHLESVTVTVGQGVQQGQQIAWSDTTGNAGGTPHLHFAVWTGNGQTDVNPATYLTGVPAAIPGQAAGTVSPEQAVYYARRAGIAEDQLATCVAIAMYESNLRLNATNKNGPTTGCPFGSTDRGLWQINSCYWPQYDATQLLSDGQYNAVAMSAVYAAQGWHGWSSYHMTASGVEVGDGNPRAAYYSNLPAAQQAVAAVPPGSTPPNTDPSASPMGTLPDYAYPPAPVDTTPQLPPQQVAITPVAVAASDLVTPNTRNAQSTALLWLANQEVPVDSLSVTLPTYLQPGSWTAGLNLAQLDAYDLWGALEERANTQIIAYMGYVRDKSVPYGIDVLTQMFSGLVVAPHIAHKDRTVTLQGPDLSGIFSGSSATLSSIPDAWVNAYVGNVVKAIVARHNPKGGGLSAVVDDAPIWAGQAAGSDFTSTRQKGVTEWDWLTQMAATVGFLCYMDGSTLRFQRWPRDQDAVTLDYAVDGEPATLVDDVQVDYLPHAKRDYAVQTQAFSTKSKQTIASDLQGNTDTNDVMVVSLPANTPKETLNARARAILQQYIATEVKLTISVAGVVRLGPNQPITLRSSRINSRFLNDTTTGQPRRYYPSAITYTYTKGRGLGMSITATSRTPAVQQTNTDLAGLGF